MLACAGNACGARRRVACPADHPRVCGERSVRAAVCLLADGSSPRLRGTRERGREVDPVGRIIPACAGNARAAAAPCRPPPDHPRVCGERASANGVRPEEAGSSPRVRGTRPRARGETATPRIIPACAGNASLDLHSPRDLRGSSPRVRGTRRLHAPPGRVRGSSPRVRGTPRTPPCRARRVRIIPACAGNAPRYPSSTSHRSDHPRVCGERRRSPYGPCPSPDHPRVCGERRVEHAAAGGARIIPACAGNAGAPRGPP